jgi:hypothetical protein
MAAYAAKAIDRRRLKEINQRLLLGGAVARKTLAPVTESFADLILKTNVLPGAVRQIAEDKAAGRQARPRDGILSLLCGADRGAAGVRRRDRHRQRRRAGRHHPRPHRRRE